MKKITMTAISLACLMAVGTTSAQELTGGSNKYTMVTCSLLNADVTLMLTGGVVGGITCDPDTNLAIGMSLCHSSGLTLERSAKYNAGETMSDGTACVEATAGAGCVETITGSAYPSASTVKGTVATRYPGSACAAGTAVTESASKITDDVASLADTGA